jgi:hypothetical protein
MSGSVSLASTNDRHDADRLHPLRRTESDRDLAYLIRTSLRFSAQQERVAQLADFIGDSQSREARICSVSPLRQFQGRLAVVGSVAHLVGRIRAASRGCGDRGKVPPRGTGRKPSPRCLASGSSDGTVRQRGWPPPFRSAPRRLATPTLSSRWGSAAAELSSRRVG